MIKKADFFTSTGAYIIDEVKTTRPTVATLKANDKLIICGLCGGVMSAKAKYCMGCGCRFKKVNRDEYEAIKRDYEQQNVVDRNQMHINDYVRGGEE